MIITCTQCQTQYRLDPALLGADGRTVMCTQCKFMWQQKHVAEKSMEDILQADGTEAELAPETVAAPEPAPAQPQTFEAVLQQTAAAIAPASKIPDAVKPGTEFATPAPTVYRPMGAGPAQFGGLVFLACCFVTLIFLFLLRGPMVHMLPSTALLYRAMGFDIKAPGEGLRLTALVAENRVDKGTRILNVEAQLTNMTQQTMSYPDLKVVLSSAYGAVLKEWVLDNKDAAPLAPGQNVAVKSEIKDPPEGGTDIDMKVLWE